LPRQKPFTQDDVDRRRHAAPNPDLWDFTTAIKHLGIQTSDPRMESADRIRQICEWYYQIREGELQESSARKAAAFKHALSVAKRQADVALSSPKGGESQPMLPPELEIERKHLPPRMQKRAKFVLPQSLRQEIAREMLKGRSLRETLAHLYEHYRAESRRGPKPSQALPLTMQALLDEARRLVVEAMLAQMISADHVVSRTDLVEFLHRVLLAAKIPHPNPKRNWSKFVGLWTPLPRQK
jgi:hypothetical protein